MHEGRMNGISDNMGLKKFCAWFWLETRAMGEKSGESMKKKAAFQVAATYIGAVMGAGFASGQEIQQFFVRFGAWGMVGIAVSALLFALLGWIMLDLQERWRVKSYIEFFEKMLGPIWGKRADFLVTTLLFAGMIAMVSGAGAIFYEYFGLGRWIGILFTVAVIVLALSFRGEGVLWINSVLIPLKFLFCLGIGFAAIRWAEAGADSSLPIAASPLIRNWGLSAVLYVSFNLTLAMVVFASLGKEVQKKGARLGAVLGGLSLGLFALVIGASLLKFPEVLGMEIPMVAVAGKLGDWAAFLYVVVLWLAMITAAVGNGFSLVSRIVDTGKYSFLKALGMVMIPVVLLSAVKFSNLVAFVYPLFGYLGLIFLPLLFYAWWRK